LQQQDPLQVDFAPHRRWQSFSLNADVEVSERLIVKSLFLEPLQKLGCWLIGGYHRRRGSYPTGRTDGDGSKEGDGTEEADELRSDYVHFHVFTQISRL
jgi:hypothetical protein